MLRAQAARIRRSAALVWALVALAAGAASGDAQLDTAAEALRDALAARDAGDQARADAGFAAAAERHPVIADHAERLRAVLLRDGGRLDAAIVAARRGVAARPRGPLRAELLRLEALAFLDAGQERAARAALEQALAADPAPALRTELELLVAGWLERAGERAKAAARYRALWIEVPSFESSEEAGERLTALEALARAPLRSAEHWRRRGDSLLARRRTEAALAAYETALSGALSADARRRALDKRAESLFLLRRYPEAAEAYGALAARDPEARLWRARAIARSGDVPAGAAALEALARDTKGALAARARYLAASLHQDDDRERARTLYAAVARDRAAPRELVTGALWALGFDAWRHQRDAEARGHFERMAAAESSPLARLRGRYWQARALERSDPAAAARGFDALAVEYPLSYYGWRAAARGTGPAAAPGAVLPAGRVAVRDAELLRPRILAAAGLGREARTELDRLAERAAGADDRLRIGAVYVDAGAYDAAQRLVVRAFEEPLARGPSAGQEAAWRLAWPRAYAELVDGFAAGARPPVEPALVLAVMREESSFDPAAISTVGARGLLQIMPDTGERLARELGIPGFRADDLFRPNVNIRLGAAYLGQLTGRFDGRASAAVGSYNAGPDAVARWLRERPHDDDDAWVEAIPYQQTRDYVRRVLRSVHAYQVLH